MTKYYEYKDPEDELTTALLRTIYKQVKKIAASVLDSITDVENAEKVLFIQRDLGDKFLVTSV